MERTEELVSLYRSEAVENIELLQRGLLRALSADLVERDVSELFRFVHNVKGMSAAMAYEPVVLLAHQLEDRLERWMASRSLPDAEELQWMIEAAGALVERVEVAVSAARKPDRVRIEVRIADAEPRPGWRAEVLLDLLSMVAAVTAVSPGQPTVEAGRVRSFVVEIVRGDDLEELVDALRSLEGIQSVSVMGRDPLEQFVARMELVVVDTARRTGKSARVVVRTDGPVAEGDLLTRLAPAVAHLVRNAVDHGIEAPEMRRRGGKSEEGCVELELVADGRTLVVSVADDGAGIDADAVAAAAIGRGVLTGAELAGLGSTDARLGLIFEPGVSTRSVATTTSGRGVGAEAVKADVEALGGTVQLHSALGSGTVVTLRVPVVVPGS